MIYNKYLGKVHEYGVNDCITLVRDFYKNELGIEFSMPDYTPSKRWAAQFTTQYIDDWVSQYAKKVSLTDLRNYDLIVFKSNKSNRIIHFALYIAPNRMLHIEEGRAACIETLNEEYRNTIYAVYRYDRMV